MPCPCDFIYQFLFTDRRLYITFLVSNSLAYSIFFFGGFGRIFLSLSEEHQNRHNVNDNNVSNNKGEVKFGLLIDLVAEPSMYKLILQMRTSKLQWTVLVSGANGITVTF